MSDTATRCVVCLNTDTHDHDANGVCGRCQYIHSNTYHELMALLGINDVHIETNAVLSTGDTHATRHQKREEGQ